MTEMTSKEMLAALEASRGLHAPKPQAKPAPSAPVDIMIDLETLGTTPGSVVLSIGAITRDGSTFEVRIDVCDSLFYGLTVDPDTMSWWRKQTRAAWNSSTLDASPLDSTLDAFDDWIQARRTGSEEATGRKIRLWGDSAAFDLGLLRAVYRAAGRVEPWHYQEEFCYKTLRRVLGSEKPRSKLQHDALSDARAQLVHLQEMLGTLVTVP